MFFVGEQQFSLFRALLLGGLCKKHVADTAYTKMTHKTQTCRKLLDSNQIHTYISQIHTFNLNIFSQNVMPEKYCTHLSYKTTVIPHRAVDYFFFFICMYLYCTHSQTPSSLNAHTHLSDRKKKVSNIDYLIVAT